MRIDRIPLMARCDAAVKVALVLSFVVAIFFPPDVLEGKAMASRAPLFLAPAVIVPLLARFRTGGPHPHTADAFLSLPFLFDALANLLDFCGEFAVTHDVSHLVNWIWLVFASHAFRFRNVHVRRDALLLGSGFGVLMIVVLAVSEDGFGGAGRLALTYGDTVGDLAVSSAGGLIASARSPASTCLAREATGTELIKDPQCCWRPVTPRLPSSNP